MEFISERIVQPKLNSYKLPDYIIDKDYKFYFITVKFQNMTKLRQLIYNIPVYVLQKEPNALQFSQSRRDLPHGQCLINQYQAIINNIMTLHVKNPKENEKIIIDLQNNDKSDKIVAYNISWQHQFCGYLLPNQVLHEEMIVKKMIHGGIQVAANFKIDKENQCTFMSLYPWKYIKDEIDKLPTELQ